MKITNPMKFLLFAALTLVASASSAADNRSGMGVGVIAGSTGVGAKWNINESTYLDLEGAAFSIKMPGTTNCVSNCSMHAKWLLAGIVKKTSIIDVGLFYNSIKVENSDFDRSMNQSLKSTGSYNPISLYLGKSFDIKERLSLDVGLIYLGRPKFSFQPGTTHFTQQQIQYEQNKAERIFGGYRYMPKISLAYQL